MNNPITGASTEMEILPEAAAVRTAAFLADGRASTFLLAETITALVSRQGIQAAIVDISTEAGLTTAHQLLSAGIEYSIFDTVPPKWDEDSRQSLELVRSSASGRVAFDPDNLAAIDANIVLMPAPASDAGQGIDATDGTITAIVLEQLKAANTPCLLVLPPEAGLRRQNDGDYVRLTLQLQE